MNITPFGKKGPFFGERRVERQEIPLYEFEAIAGLIPLFTGQYQPVDYIVIPDVPRCDGAVYVRGDSMVPILKSGDIVVYRQVHDLHNIIWGEMYLLSFNYDGEEYITVKYVHCVDGRPDVVELVSQNEVHAPKIVALSDIRALAIVKASIRINTMG
ncbi:MAG: S24 family peptidase [Rikenellaceae bacterium]|nr:S24 family peptidase [Rikenellaceae bacterium]